MTVNELVAKLNALGVSGDMEVRVEAFGGMRAGKNVKDVSIGFDWDAGSIILHPDPALEIKRPPADEIFKRYKQAVELIAFKAGGDPVEIATRALRPPEEPAKRKGK